MPLFTNHEINAQQVAACLAVVNNAGHALSLLEDSDTTTKSEPEIALEVTLMAACDRLDLILKDDKRWTLPEKDGHAHYEAVALEQTLQLALGNDIKKNEVFVAEFQKQVAIAGIVGVSVSNPATGLTVPAPEVTPKPAPKKNDKRKR